MRVDQVITLVWLGNAALLAGTGWVGWTFWKERKESVKPVAAPEWPDADGASVIAQKWPGDVQRFRHLWATHINGLVPPPPAPPETQRPQRSLTEEFRARIKIVSGFLSSDDAGAVMFYADSGSQKQASVGERIGDWKLTKFTMERRPDGVYGIGEFEHPQLTTPFRLEDQLQGFPKIDDPAPPFTPSGPPPFSSERVRSDFVAVQAWIDRATGDWVVPPEEQFWWAEFGEKDVLQKTTFVERPQGVEIASDPAMGPLDGPRGFAKGDVLVSINDVPVRSMKDVVDYLRGPGKDAERYVVVLERDGKRRTQTYRVARRRQG